MNFSAASDRHSPHAWRVRAEHLRDLAVQTQDDFVRHQLVELAETWEQMAEHATRHTAQIIPLRR